MFESRICAGAVENQKPKLQGNLRQSLSLHGRMTWKVMQRNSWKDFANLRIKQLNNCTKSHRHAWMIINLKKKMDLLENYLLFALKLF